MRIFTSCKMNPATKLSTYTIVSCKTSCIVYRKNINRWYSRTTLMCTWLGNTRMLFTKPAARECDVQIKKVVISTPQKWIDGLTGAKNVSMFPLLVKDTSHVSAAPFLVFKALHAKRTHAAPWSLDHMCIHNGRLCAFLF